MGFVQPREADARQAGTAVGHPRTLARLKGDNFERTVLKGDNRVSFKKKSAGQRLV